MPVPEPVIYELKLNRLVDEVTLTAGEVTRFSEKCAGYVAELTAKKQELTAVSVHQIIVRVTWQFFYARKGAVPAEHNQILAVYLSTLEQLHELWLDVEKPNVIERVVVEKPPRRSSKQTREEARTKTIANLLGDE